mgnify:CR=1 FL=1
MIGVSIGIVAERTGLHPQTLREYERQGLVQPARTQGGARRYGDAEIARLIRIQQLSALGMSLTAVAYTLELEDRITRLTQRVRDLEGAQSQHTQHAPGIHDSAAQAHTQQSPGTGLVRRSMSVEIVHVPRPTRGPRWRNNG